MDIKETQETQETLLTVKDVSTMLKLSPRHIVNLSKSGKLPKPIKLGFSTRWRNSELQAVIRALSKK